MFAKFNRTHWRLCVRLCSIVVVISLAGGMPSAADDPKADRPIRLFNGKDFSGWTHYTVETKQENPGVFQVVDGMIYVPGGKGEIAYYGGLVTEQPYENYRLTLDYKWGTATHGDRKNLARDAGVLVHCIGPHPPGPWITSYEFQIIEGGTGDLLLVNTGLGDDSGKPVTLLCTAPVEVRNKEPYFQLDGKPKTMQNSGRLNWWGRDPSWTDTAGFRGRQDVESTRGKWTHCDIVARNDTLEFRVNGILVNRAQDLSHPKGRILLQTEGAEIWYRSIELTPLGE